MLWINSAFCNIQNCTRCPEALVSAASYLKYNNLTYLAYIQSKRQVLNFFFYFAHVQYCTDLPNDHTHYIVLFCEENLEETKIIRSNSTDFTVLYLYMYKYIQTRYSVCGHNSAKHNSKMQILRWKRTQGSTRYSEEYLIYHNISQSLSEGTFSLFV